jgi:hypothetical protein
MSINFQSPRSETDTADNSQIEFYKAVWTPAQNSDLILKFFSVNDIKIDPSTLSTENILDSEGVITFKLNFFVNTKITSANNISEIKFSLYDQDPALTVSSPSALSPPGSAAGSDSLSSISGVRESADINPVRIVSVQIGGKEQTSKFVTAHSTNISDDEYKRLSPQRKYSSQIVSSNNIVPVDTASFSTESESDTLRRVLFSSNLDPTDYVNWRYFSNYDFTPTGLSLNPTIIDNSGEFTKSNYISLSSSSRQKSMSQKEPDYFTNNQDIVRLYKSSIRSSGSPGAPIRQIISTNNETSSLKEYQIIFNIRTRDLSSGRTTSNIYIKSQIIDKNGSVRSEESDQLNLAQELESHMSPVMPPEIRVTSDSQSGNTIAVRQKDHICDRIEINKIVINPNYCRPSSTRWKRVAIIPARVSSGIITFIDTEGSSVIYPSFVVYEAVGAGSNGKKCPVSKKIVCRGRKRNTSSSKPTIAKTHCAIYAYQDPQNNQIIIRVSDISPGISKLFLRRQLMSISEGKSDARNRTLVKTTLGEQSYRVSSQQSEYEFIDRDVTDRSVYRYYVEFDSSTGERTESSRDEVIQFRVPPRDKIRSAISFPQLPTPGDLSTSFDLSAQLPPEDVGIEKINKLLSDLGVSDLFRSESKDDRSKISQLLVFEVSRKNVRTGERITWPVFSPRRFVDSDITRSETGSPRSRLIPGDTYIYTANLLVLNPESLFSTATTSRIAVDGVSRFSSPAKKFADNFSMPPGKMSSPTTISKFTSEKIYPRSYFTGISHTLVAKIPEMPSAITNFRANKSRIGKSANIIRWRLPDSNLKDKIYCFRIDAIINKDIIMPLMTVSPSATMDGVSYEVRDEINANSLAPIQYSISTVMTDMSRDEGVVTEEVTNQNYLTFQQSLTSYGIWR